MDMNLSKLQEIVKDREVHWPLVGIHLTAQEVDCINFACKGIVETIVQHL